MLEYMHHEVWLPSEKRLTQMEASLLSFCHSLLPLLFFFKQAVTKSASRQACIHDTEKAGRQAVGSHAISATSIFGQLLV